MYHAIFRKSWRRLCKRLGFVHQIKADLGQLEYFEGAEWWLSAVFDAMVFTMGQRSIGFSVGNFGRRPRWQFELKPFETQFQFSFRLGGSVYYLSNYSRPSLVGI